MKRERKGEREENRERARERREEEGLKADRKRILISNDNSTKQRETINLKCLRFASLYYIKRHCIYYTNKFFFRRCLECVLVFT